MTQARLVRRAALAGALLLSLAGVEGAQAMPAAPTLAHPSVDGIGAVTPVSYNGYYYNGYYRRYHGSRRAGMYNCGRGALRTHLERQACGLNSVGHNGRYR